MSQPAAPPPIPRDYYALIPHPLAAQVLLIAQSDGWALPHLQTEDYDLLAGAPFCRHLQAQLGLSLTQLRVAAIHVYSLPSGQWRWLWALIALENHSPGWTPPAGARWVDRTALADLTLAHVVGLAVVPVRRRPHQAARARSISAPRMPTFRPWRPTAACSPATRSATSSPVPVPPRARHPSSGHQASHPGSASVRSRAIWAHTAGGTMELAEARNINLRPTPRSPRRS